MEYINEGDAQRKKHIAQKLLKFEILSSLNEGNAEQTLII